MAAYTHRWEPLAYLLGTGLRELGARSWAEIGVDTEIMEYDPDWDRYARDERAGTLRFFVMRSEGGTLAGYASVLVGTSRHDRKVGSAAIQDLYIAPEHRKGLAAFKGFMEALEGQFRLMGIARYCLAERENDPRGGVGIVYKRLGFRSTERIWTKQLGEN